MRPSKAARSPVTRVVTAVGLLALSTSLSLGVAQGTDPAATNNPQAVKQFEFKKTINAQLKYLLFLPKDYTAKSDKRWPLMLFLHGAGERGSDIWKVTT